jgi:hypothetical protein
VTTLVDGNGVTLGTIINSERDSVTLLTSTGYLGFINWNATFNSAQLYYTSYSAGTCWGSAYLNSGTSSTQRYIYAKHFVYAGSLGSFAVPTAASILSDGTSASVKPSLSGFSIQGIDNPACGVSSSDQYMWPLTTITRTALGLPASIATPLTIQ